MRMRLSRTSQSYCSPAPSLPSHVLPSFSLLWSQVAAQFTSTAFDPYTDAPLGSGITRLSFASPGGVEISLQDLSMPILFSIPSGPGGDAAAEGKQAACTFWDPAKGVYRCGDGSRLASGGTGSL